MRLFVTAVAVLAVGCGGSKKEAKGPASAAGQGGNEDLNIPRVDPKLCETKDKKVALFDLNQDGKPDVWKLTGEKERLTCKQVDLNFDGKKDYVAQFDENGVIIVEEYDFDFDGKLDARVHFDRKTGKRYAAERVSGFSEKPDVWEKYGPDERVETVRRDRNGDGRPDYWEQYLAGALDKILYDEDYDGKVDRKEEAHPERDLGAAAEAAAAAEATPEPPVPEPVAEKKPAASPAPATEKTPPAPKKK
jgi:hypothetical protein